VEPAVTAGGMRLVRLNGELKTARDVAAGGIEFTYRSTARAIAVLDRAPQRIRIDGAPCKLEMAGPNTVLLPRGEHVVTITIE
jgi:hypothetical protein